MTVKYASEDLYSQFNIVEPKEWDELHKLYGLTDHQTEERVKLYIVTYDNWITEISWPHLYDRATGKFFLYGFGTFNDRMNSWFTLDQLLSSKYSIDDSSIDSSYYLPTNQSEVVWDSNNCSKILAIKWFDFGNNTLKYFVNNMLDIAWKSELQLNSNGYYLDEFAKPLCFTCITSSQSSTIKLTAVGSLQTDTIEVSDNGIVWRNYTIDTVITLYHGQSVYFRGERQYFSLYPKSNYLQFVMSGKIRASGNVNSLLYKSKYITNFTPANGDFYKLFADCTALESAPLLPLTQLNTSVYESMFENCTSLTEAPVLQATTLADSCYFGMFSGCTSLTKSPDLPAVELNKESCYENMFSGCTSLNEVTCYAESITGTNSTNNWLANVASSGTFNCVNSSIWTVDSSSGIPVNWLTNIITV